MKQVVRTPKLCKRCGVEFPADPPRTNKRPACSIECAAWLHVEKRGPDECWLWTGFVDATGYGQFGHESKSCKPHRVILAEKLGRSLSPEECCMHSCDTPLCCNPAHLSIGTRGENIVDAHRKRRLSRPPRAHVLGGSTAFSEDEVTAMRQRRANGEKIVHIAKSLGINRLTVSNIVNRKTWRHVA